MTKNVIPQVGNVSEFQSYLWILKAGSVSSKMPVEAGFFSRTYD